MMRGDLKFARAVAGLVFIAILAMTDGASAINAELAKTCNALTAKAFPPREIGNPAAGSAKGSGADQQAYFKECVAKGGKMPDSAK